MDFAESILKNFLNLYWLRPETALWRTLDVMKMKNIQFINPILDVGCGDGSFTFTHLSGKTSYSFDVYSTISETNQFFDGKDIHNQSTNIKPTIIRKATQIHSGMDWKKNLLDKAENFDLYENLIQHDLNKKFPKFKIKYKTIFSNILYWLKDPSFTLSQISEILDDNGKIILFLPDKKFKNYLIYSEYLNNHQKWAKILDRGIHNNIQHCYSHKIWKQIFSNCNLKIEKHSTHLSKSFIKFWSIGLRPYSPYLIEMANKISLSEKTKIKKRLITELYPLFRSYIEYELNSKTNSNCFHMYVLKK